MKNKPVYVLGLNPYHGSTACLIRDGKVVGCVSEERFTRKKNQIGIPSQAIGFLLKNNGISTEHIDAVALAGSWPTALMIAEQTGSDFNLSGAIINFAGTLLSKAGFLNPLYEWAHRNLYQRFMFPGL